MSNSYEFIARRFAIDAATDDHDYGRWAAGSAARVAAPVAAPVDHDATWYANQYNMAKAIYATSSKTSVDWCHYIATVEALAAN